MQKLQSVMTDFSDEFKDDLVNPRITSSYSTANFQNAVDGRITNSYTTTGFRDAVDARVNNRVGKNYFINGNKGIWQRGTNLLSGYWGADMWYSSNLGGKRITLTSSDLPYTEAGILYAQETNIASSTSSVRIIECQTVPGLELMAGKTVTYSFYIKYTGEDNPIRVFKPVAIQHFGTGGSNNVRIEGSNITIDTVLRRYSCTFTLPSISDKTIGTFPHFTQFHLEVPVSTTTGDTTVITCTGLKVEEGNTMTPFVAEPFDTELIRCMRYYEKSYNYGTAPGTITTVGAVTGCISGQYSIPTMVYYKVPKSSVLAVVFAYNPTTGVEGFSTAVESYDTIGGSGLNTPRPLLMADRSANGFVSSVAAFSQSPIRYTKFHWAVDTGIAPVTQ